MVRISILFLALCIGCRDSSQPASDAAVPTAAVSGDVEFEQIRPGVWVHTTYRDVEGFGRVLSNGLAVASEREALIIDAGWSQDPDSATEVIVDEIRQASGAAVGRSILTHYHDDSVAGIGALRRLSVPTYATRLTADLMEDEGWGRPDSLFIDGEGDAWMLPVGDRHVEVFYPGPGHTVDNVVVYVPHAQVLYAGCLVRPGGTESLGNTADADIEEWAESVAHVRDRYRDRLDVVVPSHGSPAGPELLDHTIALVESHRKRSIGG